MNGDKLNPPTTDRHFAIYREFLSGIPSMLGRLKWLSERYDGSAGFYRLMGTQPEVGPEDVDEALRLAHTVILDQWLDSTLEGQMRDLQRFISTMTVDTDASSAGEGWNHEKPFTALPPPQATLPDRTLLLRSISILLAFSASQRPHAAAPQQTGRRVAAILRCVQANSPPWKLDLKCISREVHLSEDYIRHLFKSATGITFGALVRHLRLSRAAHLLRTTFLSIEEVATALGYEHATNFSRDFRSYLGVSPVGYRTGRGVSERRFGQIEIELADFDPS